MRRIPVHPSAMTLIRWPLMLPRPSTLAVLILFLAFASVQGARSQDTGPRDPSLAPKGLDSAEVAKELRAHQRRFERIRREHLPWTWPSSGPCDERIGRFCFTFGDRDDDERWERFTDPPEVVAAREELIDALVTAVRNFPDHWWMVGQLVRYLVEADRPEEAVSVARRCRVPAPDAWWCDALAGFSHHGAGRYVEAERTFDDALHGMPAENRCEWTDLSDLLRGEVHGDYRDLECTERDSLQRRIWWLSDPFMSQPGNEARTEHYSRWVMDRLQEDAESVEPTSWGNDLRRITIRYGWPDGWERLRRGATHIGPPDVTSHYGRGARTFIAASDAVEQPYAMPADDWDFDPDRPRSEHAVAFALNGVEPLKIQTALFRIADSIVVAAHYEVTDDGLTDSTDTRAFLVASRDPDHQPAMAHARHRGRHGVLALAMPAAPHVIAVEVLAPAERRAGWARFGIDPPVEMVASDLLTVRAADSLPETLDAALAIARPPRAYRAGERVALYWEVYAAPAEAAIPIRADLAVGKRGKSIFRRIAELTPFASDDPPVHISWTDIKPAGDAVFRRSVAVDLPSALSSGDYRIRIAIEIDGAPITTLEREIRIEDPA